MVEQALGHGHDVRAFCHVRPLELSHPRLEVRRGDVRVFADVEPAVSGCDAVVFCAGPGGARGAEVLTDGVGHVIHAMTVHRVDRLAAMSAAGVFARTDPRLPFAFRVLIATALKPVYDALEEMERRIAASGLDWTIVRSVGLTDGPATGRYRVSSDGSMLRGTRRIARADVAAVLLKAVETGAFSRRTILVAG